ncbi:hypothetical protein GE09DRAFT_521687 [Coniochaeta sp. 2T2.1]|nr:hypothetical protein GE09DRAFT_521687 [Coniochaeta sp. 2T2.1]
MALPLLDVLWCCFCAIHQSSSSTFIGLHDRVKGRGALPPRNPFQKYRMKRIRVCDCSLVALSIYLLRCLTFSPHALLPRRLPYTQILSCYPKPARLSSEPSIKSFLSSFIQGSGLSICGLTFPASHHTHCKLKPGASPY